MCVCVRFGPKLFFAHRYPIIPASLVERLYLPLNYFGISGQKSIEHICQLMRKCSAAYSESIMHLLREAIENKELLIGSYLSSYIKCNCYEPITLVTWSLGHTLWALTRTSFLDSLNIHRLRISRSFKVCFLSD